MLKVSIIVPVYNVADYLRQCLDSLLAQTLHDFELICINDGSTDSSLSILKEYELRDSRIRLIDKKNEGYGKTMNRGLEEAKARYIGIVESDDFVRPEMFERLYGIMEKQPADIIKCNFFRYKAGLKETAERSQGYPEIFYGQVIEPIHYPSLYSVHSSVWAALYSKQFLEDNQIRFNETPGASFQDVAFHFKVLSSAKKMMIIPDALLYYRTDNLMSSVNSPYKIYAIFDEMHSIEEYVKQQPAERQEKLWPIVASKKYYEYRWHCWDRLAVIFRFAFFEKMMAELMEDKAQGKFTKAVWRFPEDQQDFERMSNNPYAYFMGTVEHFHDQRTCLVDTLNQNFREIGFLHIVQTSEKVVIYGAGKVGKYVAERLGTIGVKREKLLFAVTDTKGVESNIHGIPVEQIEKALDEYKDCPILVAVKGEKQIVMLNHLKGLDCRNIILVDEEIYSYLSAKL